MKYLRITDLAQEVEDRETYRLLENLNTFTLIDCRNIGSLSLSDHSDILVLEHFDLSPDPLELLQRLNTSSQKINLIILVDSDSNFFPPVFAQLDIDIHVVFNPKQDSLFPFELLEQKRQSILKHLHNFKAIAA